MVGGLHLNRSGFTERLVFVYFSTGYHFNLINADSFRFQCNKIIKSNNYPGSLLTTTGHVVSLSCHLQRVRILTMCYRALE